MLIAAVDVGSSVVKACVANRDGAVLGLAGIATRVASHLPGMAEMDPGDLLDRPLEMLAAAVARSGASPDEVAAVSVTGARGTLLPLDRAGRPLGRAPVWTDSRGENCLETFVERCGGRGAFTARTGLLLDTTLSAATILRWRAEGDPAGAATCFAGPQAVAIRCLTGTLATDATNAAHYGFAALGCTGWDRRLCAAADLDLATLPAIVAPGTVVGGLRPAVAAQIGLRPGTPVLAAASDAVCYKVGAGVTMPGESTVSVGTSATFAVIAAQACADPDGTLSCTAWVTPGLWEVFALQPSGAAVLEWLRGLLGTSSALTVDEMIREAEAVAPGSDGLVTVPYLMGAGVPQDRAVAGMFAGLRPAHTRAHLARSVIEGVAFSLRDVLAALDAAGHRPTLVRMVGGAARSDTWAQVVADVLEMPVETVATEEPALLGAAMLGAVSAGLHPDIPTAIRAMTRVRRRHEPRPETAGTYARAYQHFQQAVASARALATAPTTGAAP